MELIRVLLVEDYPQFRQLYRGFLAVDPQIRLVGEAETGQEAVARFRETMPDVALVDISLPDGGGLEVTRALKRDWPNTKILLLLEEEDNEYRNACQESGANGYLLKLEAPSRLLSLVKAVHQAGQLEEGIRRTKP